MQNRQKILGSSKSGTYLKRICCFCRFDCFPPDHSRTRLHVFICNFNSQFSCFRATTSDVDYLENQCAKEPEQRSQSCDYLEYENQDLGYADLQLSTPTKDEV